MADKTFTSKSPDRSPVIRGISTINHNIRAELKLTINEYVVIDFLAKWWAQEKRIPTMGDWFVELGIESMGHVFPILKSVFDKGFIMDAEHGWQPTDAWKNVFSNDVQFEELWKLHTKGNKKTAKERFNKVTRKIRYKDLKDKLIAYLQACNESQTFMKGLDVWLNPVKEHWNDPLPVAKFGSKPINPTFESGQPPPINFF